MEKKNVVIFGLSSGLEIAKMISKKLDIPFCTNTKSIFADGEILVKFDDTIRGKNVYVVQSTCKPVHDNIFELLIFMDALKRASVNKIIVVIPYYGYARQDRKAKPHEAITAKLVAGLLEKVGANKIITFDLHSPQIEGFFDIPLDNLSATAIMASHIYKKNISNLVIVSPDHGGVNRARQFAEILGTRIAIIDKRRVVKNNVEIMNILGEVEGDNCLVIDDMIDTGNTVIKGCDLLKQKGAKDIYVAATHGIFSGDAAINFQKSDAITEVICTNTIPREQNNTFSKLKIVNIADYLSDVIKADMNSQSIGRIFKNYTSFRNIK